MPDDKPQPGAPPKPTEPSLPGAKPDQTRGQGDKSGQLAADQNRLRQPHLEAQTGTAKKDTKPAISTPETKLPAGFPNISMSNESRSAQGSDGVSEKPKAVTGNIGGTHYHLDASKIEGGGYRYRLKPPAPDAVECYLRFKAGDLGIAEDTTLAGRYKALANAKDVTAGWKIHVPLQSTITDNIPLTYKGQTLPTTPRDPVGKALCQFCIEQGIRQFKVGGGGEAEDGKGMTIYVGSYEELQKVATAMANYKVDGKPLQVPEAPHALRRTDACFKVDIGGKPVEIFARWDVSAVYSGMSFEGIDTSIEGKVAASTLVGGFRDLNQQRRAGAITEEEYGRRHAELRKQSAIKAHTGWQMLFGEQYSGQNGPDARPAFAAHLFPRAPRTSDSIDYKLIRRAVSVTNPNAPEELVRKNFDLAYNEALALAPEALRKVIEAAGPITKAHFVETFRNALWDRMSSEICTPDNRRAEIAIAFRDFHEATNDPKTFNEVRLRAFQQRAEAMNVAQQGHPENPSGISSPRGAHGYRGTIHNADGVVVLRNRNGQTLDEVRWQIEREAKAIRTSVHNVTPVPTIGFEPLIINATPTPANEHRPTIIDTPTQAALGGELQPSNQQCPSPSVDDRLAKFFDNEFFTGGQRTGFSAAANTLGAKGGLEMLLHPNEYLSDGVRYAAGTTLLGSSAIGLRADYDMAQATRRLAQAEKTGNELAAIFAKTSLERAQKLAHVTGATTTGLMLPLEAYQAGAAFRKGNYGEGSLYTAKTTSSGLLLGSIGYSAAANVASKGAQVAQAAGLTEKAIELAGMAGKYTKVAKVLGPVGVGIAIVTETIDIGIKSYQIACVMGETEEIRQSLIEAEKHAFRPSANQKYLESMKKAQNKKAYEIADPQTAEYKHLSRAGYGNLAPADIQSRIETDLKKLEQRKAELSMQFSKTRPVTTDDFGRITGEFPSEREQVQTAEGRVNLRMGNHGFGVGEAIIPSSYTKYGNAISDVETVDNRIRILHAAKEELTGDANGCINGNPYLFSYATRYEGVCQARETYAKAVQEMEQHITGFEASLVQSGNTVVDYLKSINEQREQYDRLQLADSQPYSDAKKQADHFKQEYEKNPKDRLMYGLMLITQTNLAITLGNEVKSLQRYSQTPLDVELTHVQTQKEAAISRNEMHRLQNPFSLNQPSRNGAVPDQSLIVTAEVTMDANHHHWFMKELADAGLPVELQGAREAGDGKKTYTIGFWKGHLQEYIASQRSVSQGHGAVTIALPSGKIIAFAISNRSMRRQQS